MSRKSAQWSVLYEEVRSFISLLFHVVSCGTNKKGGLIAPHYDQIKEGRTDGCFRAQVQNSKERSVFLRRHLREGRESFGTQEQGDGSKQVG